MQYFRVGNTKSVYDITFNGKPIEISNIAEIHESLIVAEKSEHFGCTAVRLAEGSKPGDTIRILKSIEGVKITKVNTNRLPPVLR